MSGSAPASVADAVPYHLRRYVANQPNVPVGHFSVLTEMTQMLIAPMEIMGYTLPENMLPDISQGKASVSMPYLSRSHLQYIRPLD
jgi:hypothetical protein